MNRKDISSQPQHGAPVRAAPKHMITATGFFVLAFGSIVGSGWVVAMGEWLGGSGPGGVVVAFMVGGAVMSLIAAAYAELLARLPRSGGEYSFVTSGIGPRAGFLTGWFIVLHLISFTAFEAFALSWFLEVLLAPFGSIPPLYHMIGSPITILNLGVGLAGIATITWFNCRGADRAVRLQRIVTFGFIGLSLALILIGFAFGQPRNLQPLFVAPSQGVVAQGIFWAFATSLLFLSGFQATANAIEERTDGTSMRSIARAMVGSVIAAALFYALIVVAASLLRPWRELVGEPLPAAAAFRDILPGGFAMNFVLVAAMISLVKTWNALHLGASRLVMALARDGMLPAGLARIDPRTGVPVRAILAVAAGTTLWLGMGRGAIVPIINMSTICITIIMILSLVALWRLRTMQSDVPQFVLPGGRTTLAITIAAALVAAAVAVALPFQQSDTIPFEMVLLVAWAVIGVAYSFTRRIAA